MTTPADTHRPYPFAPRLHQPDEPTLGISDYDALADLFLGGEPGDEPNDERCTETLRTTASPSARSPIRPTDQPAKPIVEALLVGHLPVRASFWVTQHARSVADDSGRTVAVLRQIGGEVSLDLLAPADTRRSFSTIDVRSLSGALATAARVATHWIIVVDELAEPDLIASAGLDRITLLTSADRPAVLSAYQTLKRALAVIDSASAPELGVVLMGSSGDEASRAAAQIRHAASTFLSTPIAVSVGSERIDATRAVPLYRGGTIGEYSAIELVQCATDLAEAEPTDHSQQPDRSERTVKATREPAEPTAAQTVLARYIEGLEPLAITCPIEPRVQLALDQNSRIHILTTGDGTDPVRSLTQAGAWASLNNQLILAAAQRPATSSAEPVLHLLVDDVPTNRRLLDAPIRVHLLRSIPVSNAEPVWFSTPLN